MKQEVSDLYKQFGEIARETQVKAGHKNIVLEKKLELLAKEYSQKEAQLGEVHTYFSIRVVTFSLRFRLFWIQI